MRISQLKEALSFLEKKPQYALIVPMIIFSLNKVFSQDLHFSNQNLFVPWIFAANGESSDHSQDNFFIEWWWDGPDDLDSYSWEDLAKIQKLTWVDMSKYIDSEAEEKINNYVLALENIFDSKEVSLEQIEKIIQIFESSLQCLENDFLNEFWYDEWSFDKIVADFRKFLLDDTIIISEDLSKYEKKGFQSEQEYEEYLKILEWCKSIWMKPNLNTVVKDEVYAFILINSLYNDIKNLSDYLKSHESAKNDLMSSELGSKEF